MGAGESQCSPDSAAGGDLVHLVHVDLNESHGRVLATELLEEGRNALAGSAPGGGEVDDDLRDTVTERQKGGSSASSRKKNAPPTREAVFAFSDRGRPRPIGFREKLTGLPALMSSLNCSSLLM